MKFLSFISLFYYNLKLKTKLLMSYILIIAIPTTVLGVLFYKISTEMILNSGRDNIYEIVKKNNLIIDQKLKNIENGFENIIVDKNMFDIFSGKQPISRYEIFVLNQNINKILYKYFSQFEEIDSIQIITSYYTFSDSNSIYSNASEKFKKSELYNCALHENGVLKWISTHNFSDILKSTASAENKEYEEVIKFVHPYVFSAVKMMDFSYIEGSNIAAMDKQQERPVMLVNCGEKVLKEVFDRSISVKGAYYCILSNEGQVVSHSDNTKLSLRENPKWLSQAIRQKSGTTITEIEGIKMLVCFDTLDTTGWVSAIVVPLDKMLGTLSNIRVYILYTAIAMAIFSALLAYIISGRITQPVKKLQAAIQKLGEGNFSNKVKVKGNDEIGNLVAKFNEMDEKIQKLILENYQIEIREKEAQIMALNLQMNPHFLYNTLNTINWMCIENDEPEISATIVSLSNMLQYTMRNVKEIVSFKDEIDWLQNYIYIMKKRFEEKFEVYYDVDPKLNDMQVPKLFLQPFVENAIIHGFELMEQGGILKVSACINGKIACFCVEDNGKGMEFIKTSEVLNSDNNAIGISNVNNRIKLIYGEKYGVYIESEPGKGTRILIEVPYSRNNSITI